MNNQLQEWQGKGDFFPILEVLQTVIPNEYRVLATGRGEGDIEYVKIITANSLEEAIAHIQDYDYKFYDEVTLYCDEG